MKILLVFFTCLVLNSASNIFSRLRRSYDSNSMSIESRKLSGGRYAAPNRTKQTTRNDERYITNIAECPWMASLQKADCPRSPYGYNAVYVAASWVLTNDNLVNNMTDAGAKKKLLVVVSLTTNVPWGTDGVVRRVKDIVFEFGYTLALLKVHGEQHEFIKIVPPNWKPDGTTLHTLYFWEIYSEKMDLITGLTVPADQSICTYGSPTNICLNQIPLWNYHDIWGAVLVDDKKRLVGMVYDVSNGAPGLFEYLDRASALYHWISSTVHSKKAGNYNNA